MARRRRSASTSLARTTYVTAPRQPAPIVRVSMPRASGGTTKHKKRRGHHRKPGAAMSLGKTLAGAAIAGGMIGLAESTGLIDKLPEIPLVGRKGALAIAAYFWAKNGGGAIARDVALAAATMAAYQLGKDKKISGEDY